MDQKTEEEKKAERRERKKARAAVYRARKRQDAGWIAKTKAYQAARYAQQRQDPEWVAEQAAKREQKRQDPDWVEKTRARAAARYKDQKADHTTYYEARKADAEWVAKKKASEKKWKNSNLERWKNIQRRSDEQKRQKDPVKFLLRHVKAVAKKKCIEFNIEHTDFVIPEFCPVLGIPITPWALRHSPGIPSFDRIDPRKGYVKGNVKIISLRANRLKSDCTDPAELRAVADYIEENLAT